MKIIWLKKHIEVLVHSHIYASFHFISDPASGQNFALICVGNVSGQTGSGSGSITLIFRLFFRFVVETWDHRLGYCTNSEFFLHPRGRRCEKSLRTNCTQFVEKLANVQAYHPPGPEARERCDQGGGGAARLQAHRPGLRQGVGGLQHGSVLRR